MLQKSISLLCLALLAGCVAEKRTILFVPLDPARVTAVSEAPQSIIELSVEDLREPRVIQIQTGSRRGTQIALYPDVASLMQEIIAAIAADVSSSQGEMLNFSSIRARVVKFDVQVRRTSRQSELEAEIAAMLDIDDQQSMATGIHSSSFDNEPVRKDFQIVIHAALARFASEVRTAMASFVSETEP